MDIIVSGWCCPGGGQGFVFGMGKIGCNSGGVRGGRLRVNSGVRVVVRGGFYVHLLAIVAARTFENVGGFNVIVAKDDFRHDGRV